MHRSALHSKGKGCLHCSETSVALQVSSPMVVALELYYVTTDWTSLPMQSFLTFGVAIADDSQLSHNHCFTLTCLHADKYANFEVFY